jgi:hypothetical protein
MGPISDVYVKRIVTAEPSAVAAFAAK